MIYKEYTSRIAGRKTHTSKDFYKFYIENFVDKDIPNNPYNVDKKTYTAIIDDYFKAVMEYMLYENYIYDPGLNIGKFFIAKTDRKRMNHLAINWPETNKLGRLVHFTNDHTNHFLYRIYWKLAKRNDNNKTYLSTYKFLPTRANKRLLARLILDEGYDYFQYHRGDEFKMI